jgi:hypothetical protein
MFMLHQIVDESAILAERLGAGTVGDAGRLDDRVVVTHEIDDTDETVIQDRPAQVAVVHDGEIGERVLGGHGHLGRG